MYFSSFFPSSRIWLLQYVSVSTSVPDPVPPAKMVAIASVRCITMYKSFYHSSGKIPSTPSEAKFKKRVREDFWLITNSVIIWLHQVFIKFCSCFPPKYRGALAVPQVLLDGEQILCRSIWLTPQQQSAVWLVEKHDIHGLRLYDYQVNQVVTVTVGHLLDGHLTRRRHVTSFGPKPHFLALSMLHPLWICSFLLDASEIKEKHWMSPGFSHGACSGVLYFALSN